MQLPIPPPLSGFQLLPETYVVLIYAFMNLAGEDASGADFETASSLLESMKVCGANEGVEPRLTFTIGAPQFPQPGPETKLVWTCVLPPFLQAQLGIPGAQPGWLMLCKELFRKEMIDEAMARVKRGYDADG